MKKASETFEKEREALLRRMSKVSNNLSEKVISFTNQDVPEFLKKLDQFEQLSRKSTMMVN
jgi:hypothetical protein